MTRLSDLGEGETIMKKLLGVLILLLFILMSLGFVLIKTASLGSPDNWFNQNYRSEIAQNLILRQIFGLNQDGDAKADYLSDKRSKIVVEVDTLSGYDFSLRALEITESKMERLTGKEVTIVKSSVIPDAKLSYSSEDLTILYDRYKIHKTTSDTAVFYLIYATRSAEDESIVGNTMNYDGAVIFAEGIAALGDTNVTEIEASTILHEFGHLLGLPHLQGADCIMNETLEVGRRTQKVSTEFCGEELQMLENIKLIIN